MSLWIFITYGYIRSTKSIKPSLSNRNLACYRLMLGSTLRLCISEERCRSNSITPPSSNNQAYPLAMLLSEQNRSIDIIIGDGNCFFRAISKELFGEEKHHECLRTILVEYIKLNGKNFQQYMSHGSGSIMEHCNRMKKLRRSVCYSSRNSRTVYISANPCLHL